MSLDIVDIDPDQLDDLLTPVVVGALVSQFAASAREMAFREGDLDGLASWSEESRERVLNAIASDLADVQEWVSQAQLVLINFDSKGTPTP